jgi:ABC-type molybdenum transport system ATPase subunit/photorepair protein PhrA
MTPPVIDIYDLCFSYSGKEVLHGINLTVHNRDFVAVIGPNGGGKTTLLNRILTGDHGRRYAVIVNEFGEVGIDVDLVLSSDEELFEMNNGKIFGFFSFIGGAHVCFLSR